MSSFLPVRRAPLVLAAALALGVAGCTADEAATMDAQISLVLLFILGLFVTLLQALSTLFALSRRRPGGRMVYGATTILAVVAAVGGVIGAVTVSELPPRLRHRVADGLLSVLGEVVIIVGAWFVVTLLRHGVRQPDPSPEEEGPSQGKLRLIRALVAGSAVLFLAAVMLGYWQLIHGDPTAAPRP